MGKRKQISYTDLINENSYCRKFYIELYQDWDNYLNIIKFIENSYQSYNYILHDKDVWTETDYSINSEYMDSKGINVGDVKKPHYHVIITFNNPRYKSTVIKELFRQYESVYPDLFDTFKRNVIRILDYKKTERYQTHEDEDDKHHYDFTEVRGRGEAYEDYFKYLSINRSDESRSNEIIDLILSRNSWLLVELVREINKRSLYSCFIRGFGLYSRLLEENNIGLYYEYKSKN